MVTTTYFVEEVGHDEGRGAQVCPTEIEKTLLEHPSVGERQLTPLRTTSGARSEACEKGAVLTAKDALKFCRERLAHYKVPRHVEFLDELPKTTSGKINKKALQTEGL